MTDSNKNGGAGQGQGSANDQGDNTNNQAGQGGASNDGGDGTVKYETYKRVLSEAKKAKEQLDALQSQIDEQKQLALKEKEDFKALYESTQSVLKKKEEELNGLKGGLMKAKKEIAISRYLKEKHNPLKPKFESSLDTEQVIINPESGEIDEYSLSRYCDTLAKEFPEYLETKTIPGTSNAAPKGGSPETITLSAWKALKDSKKMAAYKPEQIIQD